MEHSHGDTSYRGGQRGKSRRSINQEDRTLLMALPSQLLLESFEPLKESLLWGHVFFLRGLPLRFGAENKRRIINRHTVSVKDTEGYY